MKQLNKLLALALAVIMVMALATTAFADGEDDSDTDTVTITVNNALAGGEYKAYKIFDVTTSGGTNPSYAYTIESSNSFFGTVQSYANRNNSHMTLKAIDGTNTTYNVILDSAFEESDSKTLAKELAKTLTSPDTNITESCRTEGRTTGEGENANTTATFSNLAKGCYLITSPVGSTSALITATDNTAKIDEKTGLPTLEKKVNQKDDITSVTAADIWADYNDASFGQTVQFKIEIQVDETSDDYRLTDELPSGFTLVNNETTPITVQCAKYDSENRTYENPESISNANEDSKNYELETTNLSTNETFRITFKSAYLSKLKALDKLIVTYSATVGTNATVGGDGNTNTAKLTYGTNQTKKAETKTYIWSFDVFKFVETGTEENKDQTPLAGATFTLRKEGETNNITFVSVQDSTNEAPTYNVSTEQSAFAEITTSTDGNAGGKFTLQGLDSGTYYLTETAAPAGYNKLEGPIKVEIGMSVNDGGTASYTVKYANWQETVNGGTTSHYNAWNSVTYNVIPVENKAGSLLPSTGGIGTTIFYVLGGILVVGAGVLLITKKRMSNSK